jgi:hypothetical protein
MKVLNKIACIFLAFSFLVSSLGFTASKMVCRKSGTLKRSLTPLSDCCKKDITKHRFQHSCCDITNIYSGLSDFSASSKAAAGDCSFFVLPFSTGEKLADVKVQPKTLLFFPDLPPPYYGRNLLAHISSLRI